MSFGGAERSGINPVPKHVFRAGKALPENGALLIVDYSAGEGDLSVRGALIDIAMLVLTGGRVRTVREYRDLLARGGFRLNQVIPVPGGVNLLEALPIQ